MGATNINIYNPVVPFGSVRPGLYMPPSERDSEAGVVPFYFGDAPVRVVTVDGAPWFVARDVADVLGYAKPRNAVSEHCKGARIQGIPTAGGIQQMTIIRESDVYRLVLRSKLPTAEMFEQWVVGDVLPSIRKTGSYYVAPALPDFSNPAESARAWADQFEKRLALEQTIEQQKPDMEFVGRYVASDGSKGFRDVCKLLRAKETKFREFLIEFGIMYRLDGHLTPYANHIEAGRFEVKAGIANNAHAFTQARFTPKGIRWIAGEWAQFQIDPEAYRARRAKKMEASA